MNEELQMREGTENAMIAKDEAATFEPFEMPTEGDVADLSDDDIAASLGFHTTLSEPLIPQDEMTTAEDEAVETADESPETAMEADEELEEEPAEEEPEDKDGEQDKEIEAIRAELEALKSDIQDDETGKTTKDTSSEEQA